MLHRLLLLLNCPKGCTSAYQKRTPDGRTKRDLLNTAEDTWVLLIPNETQNFGHCLQTLLRQKILTKQLEMETETLILLTHLYRYCKHCETIAKHLKYRTLAEATLFARSLCSDPNKQPAYDNLKKSLPQFSPAAALLSRSTPKELSCIACLEYDDPDIDTGYALATAAQNPHCIAAFKSFSAKPKLLIRVNAVSTETSTITRHFQICMGCRCTQ